VSGGGGKSAVRPGGGVGRALGRIRPGNSRGGTWGLPPGSTGRKAAGGWERPMTMELQLGPPGGCPCRDGDVRFGRRGAEWRLGCSGRGVVTSTTGDQGAQRRSHSFCRRRKGEDEAGVRSLLARVGFFTGLGEGGEPRGPRTCAGEMSFGGRAVEKPLGAGEAKDPGSSTAVGCGPSSHGRFPVGHAIPMFPVSRQVIDSSEGAVDFINGVHCGGFSRRGAAILAHVGREVASRPRGEVPTEGTLGPKHGQGAQPSQPIPFMARGRGEPGPFEQKNRFSPGVRRRPVGLCRDMNGRARTVRDGAQRRTLTASTEHRSPPQSKMPALRADGAPGRTKKTGTVGSWFYSVDREVWNWPIGPLGPYPTGAYSFCSGSGVGSRSRRGLGRGCVTGGQPISWRGMGLSVGRGCGLGTCRVWSGF